MEMKDTFEPVRLLAVATVALLIAVVVAYICPTPEALRLLVASQFSGFSGALMTALRVGGTPPNQPPGN